MAKISLEDEKIKILQATMQRLMAYLAKKKIENDSIVDFLECIIEDENKFNDNFKIELEFKFDELPLTSAKLNDNRLGFKMP